MTPRIACIILHYRKVDDTKACLASLGAAAPGNGWKIFLVHNSPDDGSAPELRRALEGAGLAYSLLEPDENLGFAGGCNIGMRAALREGFTHVLLLNSDTLVAGDFAPEVERAVREFPDEVVAGTVTDMEGRPTHNVGTLSPWTGRVRHLFNPAPGTPIDFVSGCLMILPGKGLEMTGFFDEALFMYCEDMDLCMRLRAHGIRVHYAPRIRVRHRFDAATTRTGLPKEYYIQRNQAYVILRRAPSRQRILYLAWLLAMPVYKLLRRPSLFSQALRGARDGVMGRMGKRHATN